MERYVKIARNLVSARGASSLKNMLNITNAHLDKLLRGGEEGYDSSEEIADSDFVRIVITHNTRSQMWYLFYITPKMRCAEMEVFRSKQEAEKYAQKIADTYNARAQRTLERKLERQKRQEEERKNFVNPYKVGDILYSSWGYDQTNIDFYKVIAVTGQSIRIVQVADKVVGTSGQEDLVVPTDKAIGSPMLKKVGTNGYVRITSFAGASKWDGRPMGQTNAYYGH